MGAEESGAGLPPSVARVAGALASAGIAARVRVLGASARTAPEAAAACGVGVEQIVKSLVFVAAGEPVLVLVSGAHQVDEARLASLLGRPARRASAAEVRTLTGFAIGGVPPVGHPRPLRVIIDRRLLQTAPLVAAAGAPHAVVTLTPEELCRATGGEVADVGRDRELPGCG